MRDFIFYSTMNNSSWAQINYFVFRCDDWCFSNVKISQLRNNLKSTKHTSALIWITQKIEPRFQMVIICIIIMNLVLLDYSGIAWLWSSFLLTNLLSVVPKQSKAGQENVLESFFNFVLSRLILVGTQKICVKQHVHLSSRGGLVR